MIIIFLFMTRFYNLQTFRGAVLVVNIWTRTFGTFDKMVNKIEHWNPPTHPLLMVICTLVLLAFLYIWLNTTSAPLSYGSSYIYLAGYSAENDENDQKVCPNIWKILPVTSTLPLSQVLTKNTSPDT